jgi:arsenite methyltransferase
VEVCDRGKFVCVGTEESAVNDPSFFVGRVNPRNLSPSLSLCTSVSSVVYCLFRMKPDYGIDAPGVVRNLFVAGVLLLVLGSRFPVLRLGPVILLWKSGALVTGVLCLIEGVLMVVYAKHGKFLHRDRMLAMVDWEGNESVLDVGTGRGLLMIGGAKKLTMGKAVGIDIWSAKDLSGNAMDKTLRNADLEGVRDKVDVQNGDASAMKFPDASFDVVLSNLCIHNIPTRAGRDKACREIVRVLKPAGKAIISDFIKTGDYMKAFGAAGAATSRTGWDFLRTFPPLRIIEVRKPRS